MQRTPHPESFFVQRESDPLLDAERVRPQANQISPTERDLVIGYIQETATERRIRWLRTGQELSG